VAVHDPEHPVEVGARAQMPILQGLLDAAAEGMLLVDRDGRIVAANPAAGRLFRCAPGALTGSAVDELIPDRMRAQHAELRTRYVADARTRPMGSGRDTPALRRDGTEFSAAVSLGPVDDDTVLVTIADVTERRRTGEALRAREEQLALFVDHVPVALAMFDRDMRYIAATQRWLSEYGLTGQELIGRSHYEIFPDVSAWHGVYQRCLAGATERREEEGFPRADGSIQWLRWEVRPWRGAGGTIGGIVIYREDITERKRAQVEVEQSERRFRDTFEQAAVGIAHTAPSGRWLRVNRKLCEILGTSRAHLLAHRLEDVTHPDDWPAERAQLQRLLAGEVEHVAPELRCTRGDATTVWVRLTASLARAADGAPDYVIAVIEDITARRQAEVALRRLRGEMEQMLTLHVATETAAAIAHELNQPLNAVASYAEAGLRLLRAGNPKPDRLMHALENSAEQAQRAGRVMRDLLQFLRKGQARTEPLDLNAVVREALSIVDASGHGGFAAIVDLEPELRPVQASRVQVEKVLVNLLRNSVEAMRDAGMATQSITITIRTAAQSNHALVTVRDTGPGFSAETVRRAFEPFFTTKPKGIGMGLTVSRTLIEANGGELWLDKDGPGATFHFTLPFAS
jgi:PAS domain S-box-containing protein